MEAATPHRKCHPTLHVHTALFILIRSKELPAVSSPFLVTVQRCLRTYTVLVPDRALGLVVAVAGICLVKQ